MGGRRWSRAAAKRREPRRRVEHRAPGARREGTGQDGVVPAGDASVDEPGDACCVGIGARGSSAQPSPATYSLAELISLDPGEGESFDELRHFLRWLGRKCRDLSRSFARALATSEKA